METTAATQTRSPRVIPVRKNWYVFTGLTGSQADDLHGPFRTRKDAEAAAATLPTR